MLNDKYIDGITCNYKEYRLQKNGNWLKTDDAKYTTNSSILGNMVEASTYFGQLGGQFIIDWGKNRRLGLVPIKLVSISICGCTKKVYSLSYNQAQVCS